MVAQTVLEDGWDGTTRVLEILVIDAGGSDIQAAISKAAGDLQQRGWAIDDGTSDRIQMTSTKWKKNLLSIGEIASYDFRDDPRISSFITNAETQAQARPLLLVELRPIE
ncbi:hypothetical protein ACTWPT_31550 [Nonomuraea sp. 3N208]|uniref:hypothetical protein n=1 Tax=Nonomuraea sp. 3N208 TaxID=3457421 RepID=UPI003FD2535C